jgi:hypothetical protein
MVKFRFFAMCLAIATVAPIGLAQAPASSPSQGNTLSHSTRIVVLDVVVTDKKGNLVHRELTQDDFSIVDLGTFDLKL